MFDAIIIGAGVIGGTIARELSKYQLKTLILEKEQDVCMGQSRANSGIVHAGFDAKVGSLKAYFNVIGNQMMPSYAKELGVKYQNNGSIVVATCEEENEMLLDLFKRGKKNGVKGLKILTREELVKLEPNVSDIATSALYAKTGGIICPYGLTIASIGNAMDNGAELKTNFEVVKIEKTNGVFEIYSSNGEKVCSKIVINCSGINSAKIANLIGDKSFTMGGRLGEYMLLDRESGDFVSHTIFKTPTSKGKGVLVTNTVDGNILIGPTAKVLDEISTDTTFDGLEDIKEKAYETVKNIPFYNTITSFAGVRAFCDRNDFIIEESKSQENFFNVAGIESPGLTSSPAIAKFVVENLVGKKINLVKKKNFIAKRKPENYFKTLSVKEKNKIIAKDPAYGKMVCRCEQVTEGEIRRAIRENPRATTVDAVKRRTRAGMGRCQGGFCQIRVAEILAEELGLDFTEVVKSGKNAVLTKGKTK